MMNHDLRLFSFTFLLAALLSGSLHAEDLHVPKDYPTIQAAIDASAAGDSVIVAPGTYNEAVVLPVHSLTLQSSHGPEETILDGTGLGVSIVTIWFKTIESTVSGFTFRHGEGNEFSRETFGGAIYAGIVNGSTAVVSNCRFQNNTAMNGGAIHAAADGIFEVHECDFEDNAATSGGAIRIYGRTRYTIADCSFKSNSAMTEGGALAAMMAWPPDAEPNILRCHFSKNTAMSGGGAYLLNTAIVEECEFISNTATGGRGGAIGGHNGTNPTIRHSRFVGNTSTEGGGACGTDNIFVESCSFESNSTETWGGAIEVGKAALVESSAFVDNSSGESGAAIVFGPTTGLRAVHCTFAGNQTGRGGSVLHAIAFAQAQLIHCVTGNNSEPLTNRTHPLSTQIQYSLIPGGFPGVGNIDAEPIFVDAENGNYRLAPGSPGIDAGHNLLTLAEGLTHDVDGNPRFADGGGGPGCGAPVIVDMGAYEYPGTPFEIMYADFTGDQIVNVLDLLMLLGAWGEDASGCFADLNRDGVVSVSDLLSLLANWSDPL